MSAKAAPSGPNRPPCACEQFQPLCLLETMVMHASDLPIHEHERLAFLASFAGSHGETRPECPQKLAAARKAEAVGDLGNSPDVIDEIDHAV